MKILVTGAAGFVGSSIIKYFIKSFPNSIIYGLDNLSYGNISRLKGLPKKNLKFIKLDIVKLNKFKDKLPKSFDLIIHLAAVAPLPDNQSEPLLSLDGHLKSLISILEYSRLINVKKIIFMSSGAVYENSLKKISKESSEIKTSLLYPTLKYCAERICFSYSKSYSLDIKVIRLFNLYGPLQDYNRKHPSFISYIIKCLYENKTADIFNNNSQSKRDYIFISDLIDLIIKINFSKNKKFDIINACTERLYSTLDIIRCLEKITRKKLKISYKNPNQFWDKYKKLFFTKKPINREIITNEVFKKTRGSNNLARKKYNWKPKVSLANGLQQCYDYYLKSSHE